MRQQITLIPVLGLENSNGEANVLNMYCGFPQKEEQVDYNMERVISKEEHGLHLEIKRWEVILQVAAVVKHPDTGNSSTPMAR